ncbi:MAG: hypothetical protein Q4P14_00850 [Methanobacteriaceae archaeon]|nr:hypothetical protein [Methanobacteriaceae archaeon]
MYKKILALLLVACFVLCSISAVSAVDDNLATNGNGTVNQVSNEKVTSLVIIAGLKLAKNASSFKKVILKKSDGSVVIHIPKKRVDYPFRKVYIGPRFRLSPTVTVSVQNK